MKQLESADADGDEKDGLEEFDSAIRRIRVPSEDFIVKLS